MVGCNYLHAFAPNLRSRESRRRRHVARVVRDPGALGWIRTVGQFRTPNGDAPGGRQHRPSNMEIALAHFLSLARARFSCQRPDRVDTAADRRCA